MGRFIVLYRGINVGGKQVVKMEALRAMHERLGHREVQSYIQSGNVVLSASGAAAAIVRKVSDEFAKQFGFAAKVVIIDAKRLAEIVAANPYAKFALQAPKTVHLAICEGKPDAKALQALLEKTGGREAFVVGKQIVYLHAPDGFGTSKFAAGLERACGVPTTVRNWRTVEALRALAAGTT